MISGIQLQALELDLPSRSFAPGEANSTGLSGRMLAYGFHSTSTNDVTLRATGLPINSTAFFLTSAVQGLVAHPAGSAGILRLSGAIRRYVGSGQVKTSGYSHSVELEVTFLWPDSCVSRLLGPGRRSGAL